MLQQSEVLMLQGSFQSENAKDLILKLINDKIEVEARVVHEIGNDYATLQYMEDKRIAVREELTRALNRIGNKKVNLHAIIVLDPVTD